MKLLKTLGVFLFLFIVASFVPWGISADQLNLAPPYSVFNEVQAQDTDVQTGLPTMRLSADQLDQWVSDYEKAPRALIDPNIKMRLGASVTSSYSVLDNIQYTPLQRNQGNCGNCWVWAGTGVLENALEVQTGIKDRLSVQYLDSNYNGGSGSNFACCGGGLDDFASFYAGTQKAIPWSNTNAYYADGSRACGGSAGISASSIALTPYYGIASISPVTINTHDLSQAVAIANIKNVLNQNKAVAFGFFFPRNSDWTAFYNYWLYQAETDIYPTVNPFANSCGATADSTSVTGHEVVCVGYNDDDPNNSYWIMLNSWGTTSSRTHGLFRIPMNMNYSCYFRMADSQGIYHSYYSYYWETLNVAFNASYLPSVSNAGGVQNLTSVSATLNGNLTSTGGVSTTVHICWGTADGGTDAGSWGTDLNLGVKEPGSFAADISGLTKGTTYYYRCYAENSAGRSWATGTSSFVASDIVKLLGADDSTGSTAAPGYLFMERWTAASKGSVSTIRIKGTGSGNVKVAIYSDADGAPGVVLVQQGTSTPIVAGWNSIALTSTAAVNAGTSYWLAYVADRACVGRKWAASIGRYQLATYSSFSFANNPSGLTSQTDSYSQLAGWGDIIIDPPSISNMAASAVSGTAATLNGNLTSTGGVSTTVHICWGTADGGTDAGSWVTDLNLGVKEPGSFAADISGLTKGTTYYYRCYAENSAGRSWATGTSSFVASDIVKLLGADDSTGSTAAPGYLFMERWTAASKGSVSTIRIKGTGSGNVKVAIYSDADGAPGVVLVQQGTSTPIAAGWNSIALTSTAAVNAGTSYWLAYVADRACVGRKWAASIGRYQLATYSSFSFANNPSGLTSQTDSYSQLAGWGDIIIDPPSISNMAASAVSGTAATLNGNLTSTGGVSTTVHICWGTADGGTDAGSWGTDLNLGVKEPGSFAADISGLTKGTTYYYRCYAENSAGRSWATGTSSFVASDIVKLLGADDSTGSTAAPGYLFMERWTAASKGSVSTIRIKGTGSGNVKVAIYSDADGAPGVVLVQQGTSTPIVAGWNSIALTSTAAVNAGTSYWLAYVADRACVGRKWAASIGRYQLATYSSFSFANNPSGLTSQTDSYSQLAGWGDIIIDPPSISNMAASAVSGTAATLNGNLTSTGGVSTTVHICWGTADGGTDAGSWGTDLNLGVKEPGSFAADISGLTKGTTYYYRCYAENSAGRSWATGTSSFVASDIVKLLGADDSTGSTAAPGYLFMERWTAASKGSVSTIRIKGTGSGNVKVAIYSDADGAPGVVLVQQGTSTPIVAGWNSIALTSTAAVNAGTSYWLAYVADRACVGRKWAASIGRYQLATYSSFSFANNPSGLTSQTDSYSQLAGWGDIIIDPPSISNMAASAVSGTAATLNGNLTSTGGVSTTVHICWGTADGGTDAGSWGTDLNLGVKEPGSFAADISGLTKGTTYYYRCYAENSAGRSWATSTSSFVASDIVKLLGADDSTGSTAAPGYLFMERWTAASKGSVSTIRIKGTGSGNVKVAIYSDADGAPGVVLVQQGTSTPIVAGWNSIALTSTAAVNAGTSYWLAYVADRACVGRKWAASIGRYQLATYSSFSFANNPSGLTSQTDSYSQLAGWGDIIIDPPSISNMAASAVSGTAATLNGNLTSTGGVSTTVHICWGTADGGTDAGSWGTDLNLGVKEPGSFAADISGLTKGTTYYYRCYAENSAGRSWATGTSSFVASDIVKLLGADDSTGSTAAPGYLFMERWTAASKGSVSTIRIKGTGSGNVKVAIYSDADGAPGVVLVQQGTSTPIVAGWNSIALTSTAAVNAGTSYWLAYVADRACVGRKWAASIGRYQLATYSSFSFANNPSGLTSQTDSYSQLAGWGDIIIDPPSISNMAASAVSGTAATLNGNLTSTGGVSTTVHICWGTADGGTDAGSWGTDLNLGVKEPGSFAADISGLTKGTTYYYRCYAENSAGTSWATSTSSFVASDIVKLLGADDAAGSTAAPGYLFMERWTAASKGSVSTIRIKGTGSGNVKVAIYSDADGAPGVVLVQQGTSTPIVAGWNSIALTSTAAVNAGTSYWLAYVADRACVGRKWAASIGRYQLATYSSFSFANNPSGLTSQTDSYSQLAGWGEITP